MVHDPTENGYLDENGRPSRGYLIICRYYKSGSVRCHTPFYPYERASWFLKTEISIR